MRRSGAIASDREDSGALWTRRSERQPSGQRPSLDKERGSARASFGGHDDGRGSDRARIDSISKTMLNFTRERGTDNADRPTASRRRDHPGERARRHGGRNDAAVRDAGGRAARPGRTRQAHEARGGRAEAAREGGESAAGRARRRKQGRAVSGGDGSDEPRAGAEQLRPFITITPFGPKRVAQGATKLLVRRE